MSRPLIVAGLALLLCTPALLLAQDQDQDQEVSLGDAARAARKSKPPEPPQAQGEEQKVIDNDNFSVMMSKAEAERLNGKPIFSIDPSGKTFSMTSPDGTCSLSFDAKATSLISTPYVASELPQDELLKLEGPASIHDDVLEVSLHNGSGWELKEIVVGITELRSQPGAGLLAASLITATDQASPEKLPDSTSLYHLKATAGPDSITVFRANLLGDFSHVKDWHWSLVSARGIPPASMNATTSQQAANAAPPPAAAQAAPPPPTVTELPSEAAAPAEKR
jgi:hypothetical protein